MNNECAGCHNTIDGELFLTCIKCESIYDLECANVSPTKFSLMDTSHKISCYCPECCSKLPKLDNSNTPVRPSQCSGTKELSSFDEYSNVTPRKTSTKTSTIPQESANFVTETKLREILKQEISIALKSTVKQHIVTEFKTINEKIDDFKSSLQFMNNKFEEMKARFEGEAVTITELKGDNEKLKAIVKDLTVRLNIVELHMRESNVEINGIPEFRSENLVTTVMQLAKTIENPLVSDDIQHVVRVAKLTTDKERPRPVIVKLRSPRHRDSILAAVMKFNQKDPENKLSSQHLGIGGPKRPIYVSEHLTAAQKSLHAATRIKAREMSYKFVWVRNGRIFV